MNTPHSPFGAPRKELINRLQKGVVALLFMLLLAFSGMYVAINMSLEQQRQEQAKLDELLVLTHSAKENWLQWLLFGKDVDINSSTINTSDFSQALLSEYRLIESRLSSFPLIADENVSDSFILLDGMTQKESGGMLLAESDRIAAYASITQLKALSDKLQQISVGLDYEHQLFSERLMLGCIAAFIVLMATLLMLSVRFAAQLRTGFSSLQAVLDHYKHSHAPVLAPRNVVDELTDIGHFFDNELASRDFDIRQSQETISLVEKAFGQVDEAFFITNHEGDVSWLSAGAERLWFKNTSLFESIFGIDSGLDDPIGERIADSILLSEDGVVLTLSDGMYQLSVKRFVSEGDEGAANLQCFISIKAKSEMAELEVLHHSLKLMSHDVWDAPIRPLRVSSPYASFAKSLEQTRQNVISAFNALNTLPSQTKSLEKVTKLQQIASLIDEETNHNELSANNDVALVDDSIAETFQNELGDVVWLSEQIRDSLILGYELVLQRLALVEKDLSSDVFLLGDVERWLNEVRAGVLTSLAATEGQSESIRHRFAVDLQHDISNVQNQIEGMKSMTSSTLSLLESDRSVGVARLDKARLSVNEVLERLHSLMERATISISSAADDDISAEESNSEWEAK
ncbi:hypothetical protein [Marinomonas foliarum]|uniref:Methyl-accepting chemotaxis protein n=1 Tax=Marinomonas foliarum TaxID=491950 RepID=A0ABX7ILM2_9GAMM|nr:hypothetical protein [Marinomonas foliarum]QRV23210.1 hypothetical protein JSY38_14225 [Marinomonas foliarum]